MTGWGVWGQIGESHLGRQLTLFMALCVYVGNAMKDVACAPRPRSPPVQRLEKSSSVQEYGVPSTHTINTLCMAAYIIRFFHRTGALSTTQTVYMAIFLAVWTLAVCYGERLARTLSPGASSRTRVPLLSQGVGKGGGV